MATEFRRFKVFRAGREGSERVALRFYGGKGLGLQVKLLPGAASLESIDEPLLGDGHEVKTLRQLAETVGNGA